MISAAPPSKKLDGIYRANQCRNCGKQILPAQIQNLQTIRGIQLKIHAVGDYVLELQCPCGRMNFILQHGLTEPERDEIVKLTKLATSCL